MSRKDRNEMERGRIRAAVRHARRVVSLICREFVTGQVQPDAELDFVTEGSRAAPSVRTAKKNGGR